METKIEFVQSNLQAIVEELELCKFSCEAGSLENDLAFQELKRIASDKHNIAACLAGEFYKSGASKSKMFIASEDVGFPIRDEMHILVTVEYCYPEHGDDTNG